MWKGKTKTNQKMFHKNRKLAALEPRHLLPVWLLEMYWERPRNLFFHYARCCCCCRCQRCLPAAAACVLLGFGFGFDFDFGCGCGDSDGDFGNSASPVGNERVRVCVSALFVSNVSATKLKICCTSNRTNCAADWGSSSREFVEGQRCCCCCIAMLCVIVVRHLIR